MMSVIDEVSIVLYALEDVKPFTWSKNSANASTCLYGGLEA